MPEGESKPLDTERALTIGQKTVSFLLGRRIILFDKEQDARAEAALFVLELIHSGKVDLTHEKAGHYIVKATADHLKVYFRFTDNLVAVPKTRQLFAQVVQEGRSLCATEQLPEEWAFWPLGSAQRALDEVLSDKNIKRFTKKEIDYIKTALTHNTSAGIAQALGLSLSSFYRVRKQAFDKLCALFDLHESARNFQQPYKADEHHGEEPLSEERAADASATPAAPAATGFECT